MNPVLLIENPDDAIAVLTLNRPDRRNALNLELIEALREAIQSAAKEQRRVLILRGAGPVFCAGLDLHESADANLAPKSATALAALIESFYSAPLVTITAANGSAFGGGAGLIAACDFAVLADDMRIGYPEVKLGIVPALVSCILRRQMRWRDLRELLLLGRTIDAAEAVRLGLASRTAPAHEVFEGAMALARQCCAAAPHALASTKELLGKLAPIGDDLREALKFHFTARTANEASEGMAAFREKRSPGWTKS